MNSTPQILRVVICSALRGELDYLAPVTATIKLLPGLRVLVPLGKRQVVGVIWSISNTSNISITKLKTIIAILDDEPLWDKTFLQLLAWVSSYYHAALGSVLTLALPKLLRGVTRTGKVRQLEKNIRQLHNSAQLTIAQNDLPILNHEQQTAIAAINSAQNSFQTLLLDGVTGSGKTEVYLQTIAHFLQSNWQILVLVPEINLTPQTIQRFTRRFPKTTIVVWHSQLTPKARYEIWQKTRAGNAQIVIGTRSAVFLPFARLGLIIVDEEHDQSFKQQSGLHYSARDLAIVRGKLTQIPIVLGSATPSTESSYNALNKRYRHLLLPQRAGGAQKPTLHLVDLRNRAVEEGIATELFSKVQERLNRKEQVLFFLNRRGFAPMLMCPICGWSAECSHCDARLIYHYKQQQLRCHHCGEIKPIPPVCPKCCHEQLRFLGMGTERIEQILQTKFPENSIARFDRDTLVNKQQLDTLLQGVRHGDYQLLVGTQMLAKGHHFPNVTMVVILDVDQSLSSFDFRSEERLAQLIVQVAGRAGRAERAGEVYIQTYNPHHPLLQQLLQSGYSGFLKGCLTERRQAHFPPFAYLALLQAENKIAQRAEQFLRIVKQRLLQLDNPYVQLLGPVPCVMEKRQGYFRQQLLLQSTRRDALQKVLTVLELLMQEIKVPGNKCFLDIDPLDLFG